MGRRHLIALFLVMITAVVYWRVQDHGFIWDDRVNVYENPYLNPVTLPNLLHFWQEPYKVLYIPLTYTVWAGIARFAAVRDGNATRANLDPQLFHIANLVLHLMSVVLVFVILRTFIREDWACAGGALLFALHPVQVEPVAWITGMKDILSGLLSLVALWQYLVYAKTTSPSDLEAPNKIIDRPIAKNGSVDGKHGLLHYGLATGAFMLALLAKPTAIVVPGVAWMLDRWMLGRPWRRSLAPLVGWVVLAMPFVVLVKLVQPDSIVRFVAPLWARPLVAGDAMTFYIYKLALPVWMGPDYGRSPEWVLQQGWVYFIWIFPCALAALVWLLRDRWPWLLASTGIFIIGVLPVSGLVPFTFQYLSTVADRYLYLSMLGPALALAWLLSQRRGRLGSMVCALVLAFLAIASALQARVWHDEESLWRHALTVTLGSSSIHYNLAVALQERGQLGEATEHYQRALEINPMSSDAHINLGTVLSYQGKLKEAIAHYRRALEINPVDAVAHYNLGNRLAEHGELEEAAEYYRRALAINPSYVDAHYNLGSLLSVRGDLEEAAKHYRRVLEINSADADAHQGLGKVLDRQGNVDEAIKHYEQALQLLKAKKRISPER